MRKVFVFVVILLALGCKKKEAAPTPSAPAAAATPAPPSSPSPTPARMGGMAWRRYDMLWDAPAKAGTVTVRLLLQEKGQPFVGKDSVEGRFMFRARQRGTHSNAFNPNDKGRYVYDELDPGTHALEVEDREGVFQTWKKEAALNPGSVETFTVDLVRR